MCHLYDRTYSEGSKVQCSAYDASCVVSFWREIKTAPVSIWCQNGVVSTSIRRHHVASTLIRRHFHIMCPLGALPVCNAKQGIPRKTTNSLLLTLYFSMKIDNTLVVNAYRTNRIKCRHLKFNKITVKELFS